MNIKFNSTKFILGVILLPIIYLLTTWFFFVFLGATPPTGKTKELLDLAPFILLIIISLNSFQAGVFEVKEQEEALA